MDKILLAVFAGAITAIIGNAIVTDQNIRAMTEVREAVNMIEEAARSIEEDMNILRNIADREQCYAGRGEWSDEHGCFLQEVGQ